MNTLLSFTHRVARAASEREVAAAVMDHGAALLGGSMLGFYLLGAGGVAEIHTRGVGDAFVDEYERVGRAGDPLLARILTKAVPVARPLPWLATHGEGGYRDFVLQQRHVDHYLLMPIVDGSRISGTINVARPGRRFGAGDLSTATSIALHVSARVAVLRVMDGATSAWDGALTPRLLEVATVAVRGHAVAEIATALGVSPNTIKKHFKELYTRLGVRTRAELSAALVRGPAVLGDGPAVPSARHVPHGGLAFRW